MTMVAENVSRNEHCGQNTPFAEAFTKLLLSDTQPNLSTILSFKVNVSTEHDKQLLDDTKPLDLV